GAVDTWTTPAPLAAPFVRGSATAPFIPAKNARQSSGTAPELWRYCAWSSSTKPALIPNSSNIVFLCVERGRSRPGFSLRPPRSPRFFAAFVLEPRGEVGG